MWHRLVLALVGPFFALVVVASTPGQQGAAKKAAPKPKPPRVHELVGAGRWLHEGGGLGRNAASANAPLLQRPELAWRESLTGTLIGEPRVWDDHIVLAIKVSDTRRRIEVRRLMDGSVVGAREINCVTDPALAVWGGEIVWRCAKGCLELLRFDDFDVKFVKRMKAVKEVSPPMRLGNHVFAIVDGRVVCMRATDFHNLWQGVSSCVGTLSFHDGQVYALQRRARSYMVVALDALTGKVTARSASFKLRRDPGEELRMQIAGKTMVVRLGEGECFEEVRGVGIKLNALQLTLPLASHRKGSARGIPCLHALDRQHHIATMDLGKNVQLGFYSHGQADGMRLDSCDLHRELARVPATLVDGVMYLGACAIDTERFRMLWRMQSVGGQPLPASRAIPAGRSLLFFDENELVSLHAGAPHHAVARELRDALHIAMRDQLEPLVREAIKAHDWPLAHDLLARCRELRAGVTWARMREKQIETGERNKRRRLLAGKSQLVRKQLDLCDAAALQAVFEQVAGWQQDRDLLQYRHGLRFVLNEQPGHQAATEAVRALLPESLRAVAPFHAMHWLDYLGATAHTPVTQLHATTDEILASVDEPDAFSAVDKRRLLQWRKTWRGDLNAVQSERLMLFSPLAQPGSLSKALATGELVCDLLEQMFGHMPKVRTEVSKMLVFIYPDRDDYLAESKKIGVKSATWAAGYYSWYEKPPKSRLYVPHDEAGFTAVLPTLAHELTHQWLMDRCPAYTPNLAAARVGPKAYWIVEGFASLVEQFAFDLERREYSLGFGGSKTRIDMVASLTPAQHLDWQMLTDLKRDGFARLVRSDKQLDVGSRTRLGRHYRARPVDLFYAQSAMLARYLYEAEHGRYRQKLLDFVVNYYTGKLKKLDFEDAFGIAPNDLGPKVYAYSKQLLE